MCNITNNIDTIIDKRLVRFIYNSINHSNKASSNILRVKLLCVNSTLSSSFQYLSFKYGLTDADWYIKVIEKCAKNFNGYSRLALNNHESNIDC